MNEAKFTPGPWDLTERSERDGICWDITAANATITVVRGVACPPRIYGETQSTANAQLIVAAPDLYAACLEAMKPSADLSVVQAALAKARGEVRP